MASARCRRSRGCTGSAKEGNQTQLHLTLGKPHRGVGGGGTAVVVEIADRGPGLAAGDEGRVFDKFYRGSTASSPGAGLGLAICRAVIETHGGKIWAENRPGRGAVFRFTLPLGEAPPDTLPTDG